MLAKSTSSMPPSPRVTADTGIRRAQCALLARSSMYRVISGWSFTGAVLAIAATAVKPPAAAARSPVAIVSFSGKPGSRKCTCGSMSPGTTQHPCTSTTVMPSGGFSDPAPSTAAISPSRTSTSYAPSMALAGSITLPPLSSIEFIAQLPFPLAVRRSNKS